MASCCLRARFSRARSRCRLKAEKNAEMQAIKPLITSPTILGASREIQCFLQIRTFGDGQAIQIAEVRHVSLYAGHISSDLLDGPNFHREVSVLSARLNTCGKCFLQQKPRRWIRCGLWCLRYENA